MTTTRSITLWSLLVAALWTASITLHLNVHSQQMVDGAGHDTKPITMGIRN